MQHVLRRALLYCPFHVSHLAVLQGAGLSWLFPLVDGAPPIGWHDALAYLVMPVLLIISQAWPLAVLLFNHRV